MPRAEGMRHTLRMISITSQTPEWHDRFFAHVRMVFPEVDFMPWSRAGLWTERYDVLALVDRGEILATAGRTRMVLSLGEGPDSTLRTLREALQLGAVAVRPDFHGKGLGRALLQAVITDAETRDLPLFLFSNPDAAGFYEALDFRRVPSCRPMVDLEIPVSGTALRQAAHLRLDRQKDRQLVAAVLSASPSHQGGLSARPDLSILLFHLLDGSMTLHSFNAGRSLAITERKGQLLVIRDWLGEWPGNILSVLPRLIDPASTPVRRIEFGFVPPPNVIGPGRYQADRKTHFFLRGMDAPQGPHCFPHLLRT